MNISLLISTYNWPEALTLCLESVLRQKDLPNEILIADDGSGKETERVIEEYKSRFNIPVVHIWHEDDGFQLAKIRNKAIAKASSEYIVQIDGDLILHPYFIRDHRKFARKGTVVRASRIYLNQELSEKKIKTLNTEINRLDKGVSNFFSAFRIPFLWKYFEFNYKNKGDERWEIHGANMAYWREDAISVNGYNEDFKGWGPEDKEFVARLLNIHVKKRFLKFGGIVFHIWHKINAKENLGNNNCLFARTKQLNLTYCDNGIDKYLKSLS
ncbi:glycosyltransferase family 2 protein [Sphingobacterium sp. InxBP1]|uniref:glycosyltransferase family 2 protein n=1 Tax=Sphingobacterium sp. InxBP1 TaxID=2870328 RepID=UPI0022440D4A|nr:glycosyltransferase family 2 protein [Sphingobacterium sp. InxBP1]MCW8312118.1 glycosyltransferase family 2 protein [Sphingobacterium sp. InxBP1]